jgi:hypothetical protein
LSSWRKASRLLRENPGASFIVAFLILYSASNVASVANILDGANAMSGYEFSVLVIGIVLQVASYVKRRRVIEGEAGSALYGEIRTRTPRWPAIPKLAAVALGAVVILAAGAATLYPRPSATIPLANLTQPAGPPKLTLTVTRVEIIHETNNFTLVDILLSTIGGTLPYNFTARWGDNFVQTSTLPTFPRTFPPAQSIPKVVDVTVKSPDGESARVNVNITGT